jgi:hypothetical protein
MRTAPRLLLATLATLTACEEGLPGRDPLFVNGVSGADVAMTGTSWRLCTELESGSELYREVHGEEGAVTFLLSAFEASGCAGTGASADPTTVYGESRGDATVGWSGRPPPGLETPPPATRVRFRVGNAIVGLDVYLVDDRAAERVLYTGDPRSSAADGYPTLLLATPEREQ